MAQITESTVRVDVVLRRDVPEGLDHAIVRATSYDEQGRVVRHLEPTDIYDLLSAARQSGISALLDDVIARVKADWEIT